MKFSARPLGRRHAAGVLVIVFTCGFVTTSGAPPPAIAAFAGEWSGKSAFPVASDTSGKAAPDARRYWIEGDIVRGEVISWGGNMQSFHVALIPRGTRFLKILTPEGGAPEYFVGHAAEGGVLWTSVESDRTRFIERVTGEGDERRFELLFADREGDAEKWRPGAALKPESAAVTGVIGEATPEPKLIEPLVYPTPQELEFFDRVSEVVEQRDLARSSNTRLVQELASAWRELGQPEAAGAPSKVAAEEIAARDSQVQEAQKWSVELEKSLTAANARADGAEKRAQALEAEVARLKAESAGSADAVAAARLSASQLASRLEEISGQLSEAAAARAEMQQELQDTRAELIASTNQKAELEKQLADASGQADAARKLQAELAGVQSQYAAARLEAENLLARLSDLQRDNARLETTLAAAEKAAKDPAVAAELEATRASVVKAAEETAAAHATIADLRKQLDEVTADRARVQEKLSEKDAAIAASITENEQRFSALARVRNEAIADLTAANERNAILQKRVAELEQSSQASAGELAGALEKIATLEPRMAAALVENKALEKALREARETPVENPELVARVANAEQLSAKSAAALSEAEDEIASLTEKLATLIGEKAALAGQLAAAEAQPEVDPDVAERLASTEKQLATVQQELAVARDEISRASSARALLETQIAQTRNKTNDQSADTTALKARISQLEGEAVAEAEEEAVMVREPNAAKTDLAGAVKRAADLDQQVADLTGRLDQRGRQSAQFESELSVAREQIRELEGRLAGVEARAETLQGEKTTLRTMFDERVASPDSRIQELESRLADTYSRAESRQAENNRLRIRVASLEAESQRLQLLLSGGASAAPSSTADSGVTAGAIDALRRELAVSQARSREFEARNSDLAAKLAETEVRLAARSGSAGEPRRLSVLPAASRTDGGTSPRVVAPPPAPARSTPPASAPLFVSSNDSPAPASVEASGAGSVPGRVQFRMPGPSSTPARQAPTRPPAFSVSPPEAGAIVAPTTTAAARAGTNPLLVQAVRLLPVDGVRRAGADSMIVINGRPFRTDDVVDEARGLRFVRVEPDAIVFAGPDGGEYRRPL
ncbi:MAG TPA: hypothetical protein VGA56_19570 [Opitutaceae bacterium]